MFHPRYVLCYIATVSVFGLEFLKFSRALPRSQEVEGVEEVEGLGGVEGSEGKREVESSEMYKEDQNVDRLS